MWFIYMYHLVRGYIQDDKNKCNIITNTCGLNNEIVKHRLSCIPIHIKDVEEFPLKNYILELNNPKALNKDFI